MTLYMVQVHEEDQVKRDNVYLFKDRKNAIEDYRRRVREYRFICDDNERLDLHEPEDVGDGMLFGKTVFMNSDGTDTTFTVEDVQVLDMPICQEQENADDGK